MSSEYNHEVFERTLALLDRCKIGRESAFVDTVMNTYGALRVNLPDCCAVFHGLVWCHLSGAIPKPPEEMFQDILPAELRNEQLEARLVNRLSSAYHFGVTRHQLAAIIVAVNITYSKFLVGQGFSPDDLEGRIHNRCPACALSGSKDVTHAAWPGNHEALAVARAWLALCPDHDPNEQGTVEEG